MHFWCPAQKHLKSKENQIFERKRYSQASGLEMMYQRKPSEILGELNDDWVAVKIWLLG
jgi:hypothetical protein